MSKNTIKNTIMVVSIILCFALAGGWIVHTVMRNNKQKEIEDTAVIGDIEREQSSFLVTPDGNEAAFMSLRAMPLSVNGDEEIATQADNSYILTATIQPSNASNQSVTWAAAWKSSSSSWASGKAVSNYVTVTALENEPLKSTVTCLEAFGEQVIITATTNDGTNLTAQCTCDYVKRVTKIELNIPKSSMSDDVGFNTASTPRPWYVKLYPSVPSTGASSIKATPVWGVGTVEDELAINVDYGLSDNFYKVLASKGYSITSDNYAKVYNATSFQNNTEGCQNLLGRNFFSNVNYANAVISSFNLGGECMVFTVTATGKYGSYTNTYSAFVNTSAMPVQATSVNIGDSNIKF